MLQGAREGKKEEGLKGLTEVGRSRRGGAAPRGRPAERPSVVLTLVRWGSACHSPTFRGVQLLSSVI